MLNLLPLKDWLYIGGIIALIAAFGLYTKHERDVGAAHEIAAIKISSAKLEAETAKQTADLKARATMAEQAYDKEILGAVNSIPMQPVRLCVNPSSGSVMPGNAGQVARTANTGSPTSSIQPVPSGDNSGGAGAAGPDISGLLNALAASADQVSATLREFQSR